MLKIAAPFRERKEVIPLIEAGVDELYCGYLSPEWVRRYTSLEFERKGGGSNFTDLKELKEAVNLAHKKNIPVYLTLNGLYVKSQYPLLLKIVRQIEKIDFDSFIIADIGLLLILKKMKTKKQIHISTGGTVFNSESVKFYKELGASRIVLDRQTTLKSMAAICENNPGMDFEVFILTTLCVYIDGFCTFLHAYLRESAGSIRKKVQIITSYDLKAIGDACCLKYSVNVFDSTLDKKINTNRIKPAFYKQAIDGVECDACALYDIMRAKVKSVKIVGRQLTPEKRLMATKFIRACLDILEKNKDINRRDFICRVQELYRMTFEYKKRCRGNNCYHPEVMLNGKSNLHH